MRANEAGKLAEDVIAAVLVGVSIDFQRQVVIGRTIYGSKRHVDFLVRNLSAYPRGLVIESKWQRRQGTVEEKFPYLVDNIQLSEMPTVVVVHGGGCHPGAWRWLLARRDGVHLVHVFRLEEFIAWVQQAEKQPSAQLPLTGAESMAVPRRE